MADDTKMEHEYRLVAYKDGYCLESLVWLDGKLSHSSEPFFRGSAEQIISDLERALRDAREKPIMGHEQIKSMALAPHPEQQG